MVASLGSFPDSTLSFGLCYHGYSSQLRRFSSVVSAQLWDLKMRTPITSLKHHQAPVLHAQLSPDERWLATGDESGNVKVRWEAQTLRDGYHKGR